MKLKRSLALIAGSLVFPVMALAHPGHDGHDLTWDFSSGALHPLTGLDHLVAMVAVGLWAAQLGGRARWQVPGTFVATMALGAMLGRSGWEIAGIEQGIAVSLLVFGLLIASARHLPVWAAMALAAGFAAFHGYAHGAATPVMGDGLLYGAGFTCATAVLHLAGIRMGMLLTQNKRVLQVLGSAVAGAGLVAFVLA